MSGKTETGLVFTGALLLFATSVTTFQARVTDISALRVLDGDVPYRDFWTMYAPGSLTVLAGAFAIFGRQLLVSNVLGILTSAAAVALYYPLAKRVAGPGAAGVLTGLVAVAFYGTGYHDGFTSYPPALLLVLVAIHLLVAKCEEPGWRWAIGPGALFGAATWFKHDVAGYATIAAAIAVVVARYRAQRVPVLLPSVVTGFTAAAVTGVAVVALVLLGAGPDLWRDVVWFPLTDFVYVRPEYLPILPRLRASSIETAQELVLWGICNLPTLALMAGLPSIMRRWRDLDAAALTLVVFSFIVFWFHWSAAHVQLNTNAISLAAWGALVGAAGLARMAAPGGRFGILGVMVVVVWGGLFVARSVYGAMTQNRGAYEWVGLPYLRGIRVPHADAVAMRRLAASMTESADADAPLLFVSHRNDIVVFAEPVPYWLTSRRPATRHHELHPGVTDTEPTQRQMLNSVARGLLPVVVREHGFEDEVLDATKTAMMRHVPLGSTLLDRWIAEHFDSATRFGAYEVMSPKRPRRALYDSRTSRVVQLSLTF